MGASSIHIIMHVGMFAVIVWKYFILVVMSQSESAELLPDRMHPDSLAM